MLEHIVAGGDAESLRAQALWEPVAWDIGEQCWYVDVVPGVGGTTFDRGGFEGVDIAGWIEGLRAGAERVALLNGRGGMSEEALILRAERSEQPETGVRLWLECTGVEPWFIANGLVEMKGGELSD